MLRSTVSASVVVWMVPVASRKWRQSLSGVAVLVAGELAGEEAVEVAGDDGQGGVDVDVEREAEESALRWKP